MRLIDADTLLEKVEKIQPWDAYLGKYAQGIRHCMELVSLLIQDAPTIEPSAQPEQRWILCSERLPHGSCSDLVNVSIHDDSGDTPFDYTSCGWVTTDGEYWIVDNEINNHVIAWMPLPSPYGEWRTDEQTD